jgi:RNA polymerase sigma-70 factor (ECF subfamily)
MQERERESLFQQWLNDHRGLIYKVTRAYAQDADDQDDLFQEIVFQLWQSLPSFRGSAKVSTWIYRVALNTALTWRRGETKHRRNKAPLVALSNQHSADQSGPAVQESRETRQRLYGAIYRLSKIDCALALLYLNGLTYREMAEILGISESNVGVKLSRIKRTLAHRLEANTDGP